jgi:hypothetical protein
MSIKHESLTIMLETWMVSFTQSASQARRCLVIENGLSSLDSIGSLGEKDLQIDNLPLRYLSPKLKKIFAEWDIVKGQKLLELLSNIILCPDDGVLMDLENCEIIQAPEKFTLMSFPIDAMREHC